MAHYLLNSLSQAYEEEEEDIPIEDETHSLVDEEENEDKRDEIVLSLQEQIVQLQKRTN
nr:2368_t:CDS:2 [Entrophospora candida]